jgi:hypothetical protein
MENRSNIHLSSSVRCNLFKADLYNFSFSRLHGFRACLNEPTISLYIHNFKSNNGLSFHNDLFKIQIVILSAYTLLLVILWCLAHNAVILFRRSSFSTFLISLHRFRI